MSLCLCQNVKLWRLFAWFSHSGKDYHESQLSSLAEVAHCERSGTRGWGGRWLPEGPFWGSSRTNWRGLGGRFWGLCTRWQLGDGGLRFPPGENIRQAVEEFEKSACSLNLMCFARSLASLFVSTVPPDSFKTTCFPDLGVALAVDFEAYVPGGNWVTVGFDSHPVHPSPSWAPSIDVHQGRRSKHQTSNGRSRKVSVFVEPAVFCTITCLFICLHGTTRFFQNTPTFQTLGGVGWAGL